MKFKSIPQRIEYSLTNISATASMWLQLFSPYKSSMLYALGGGRELPPQRRSYTMSYFRTVQLPLTNLSLPQGGQIHLILGVMGQEYMLLWGWDFINKNKKGVTEGGYIHRVDRRIMGGGGVYYRKKSLTNMGVTSPHCFHFFSGRGDFLQKRKF